MSRRELFKSLVVLMLAGWFFRRFLFALAVEFGLESGASLVAPEWRLLPVAQALNEELVLRALLLGFVVRQLGTRWWVSPLCAAVFAAGHYVLYRFGTQQVTLEPTAFLTLFLFGMTANDLFLRFRHVGYSIALHLGWNLTRFGEQWMLHDRWLGEAQSFNLIEGNTRTVIAAAGLWVFVRLAMALPKRN